MWKSDSLFHLLNKCIVWNLNTLSLKCCQVFFKKLSSVIQTLLAFFHLLPFQSPL